MSRNDLIRDGSKKKTKKRQHDDSNVSSSPPKSRKAKHTRRRSLKPATVASHQDSAPSLCVQTTLSLHLPLAPISQASPIAGLCAEHLSPLILSYYPPLRGIVLSYKDVRLSEHPSTTDSIVPLNPVYSLSVNEYAASFIWLTATFLVLRPHPGQLVTGQVVLQNEGHIGLVCWNLFNASIERAQIPTTWKWKRHRLNTSRKHRLKGGEEISDGQRMTDEHLAPAEFDDSQSSEVDLGHYVDEHKNKVPDLLQFQIEDVEVAASADRERSFLSIKGTLLDREKQRGNADSPA